MNRSEQRYLLLLLAAGIYGLGWLAGLPLSSAFHSASKRRPPAPARAQLLEQQPALNTPKAHTGIQARTLLTPAQLQAHRKACGELQARILQLDREGKAHQARELVQELVPWLRSLPAEDYPEVWRWFCELKTPDFQRRVGRSLVCAWARSDPQSALAAALTYPDLLMALNPYGAQLDYMPPFEPCDHIMSTWGEMEPQPALAAARAMPEDPPGSTYYKWPSRPLALAAVVNGIARTDPDYALRLYQELPDQVRCNPQNFIPGLVASRPEAAAAFAQSYTWPTGMDPSVNWGPGDYRKPLLGQVAEEWAAQEPARALDWAHSLPDPQQRDFALQSALRSMTTSGSAQTAFEFLQAQPGLEPYLQPTPNAAEGLVTQMADLWALTDVPAAVDWFNQLPADSPLRGPLWAAVKQRWTQQDPASAVPYLLTSFSPEEARQQLAEIVTHAPGDYWLRCDLPDYLPPGRIKDGVLAAMIGRGWLHICPEQAAQLAAQMSPGEEQSAQAPLVADAWAGQAAPAAAAWVSAFPPGSARDQAIALVVQKWTEMDPAAAKAWLEKAGSSTRPGP